MNHFSLIRWGAVAALVWQGVAVSSAEVPVPASKPSMTFQGNEAPRLALPASQHELWQQLLKLLSEDGGFTPKDRVEALLGIRFAETRQETDPPTIGSAYWHRLDGESEGLGKFRIVLFDDPKKTDLVIGWERTHCLNLPSATQDLHRLGWINGEISHNLKTGYGQLLFWLPEEARYARTHGIEMYPARSQGWSLLSLVPINHQSNCLHLFSSKVWRTPLHKQSTHTNPGK